MQILLIKWPGYMIRGVQRALSAIGIEYKVLETDQNIFEYNTLFENTLRKEIEDRIYSAVFSINFFPLISRICEEKGIKYISWGYDAPIKESCWEEMKNSCNEIYDFDRGQVDFFRKKEIKNIYHMPLAADVDSFQEFWGSDRATKSLSADISFVGNMYHSDYSKFYTALSEPMRGYTEACVEAQKVLPTGYIIPDVLTQEKIVAMCNDIKQAGVQNALSRAQLEFLLSQEATRRNRYLILSFLAKHYDTYLYSGERIEIEGLKCKGGVDYYKEMPKVFSCSKINLNISLKAIRTGIPLRALDIMGCGGFLLSNIQEELLEQFQIGEECEVYSDVLELKDKVAYYLEHEETRKRIAERGYEKIKKNFCFEDRLKRMLKKA